MVQGSWLGEALTQVLKAQLNSIWKLIIKFKIISIQIKTPLQPGIYYDSMSNLKFEWLDKTCPLS